MVKVDLSNQELLTFDPVPPGTYRVAVDQCEERVAQSGADNIFMLFKVTDVLAVRGNDSSDGLIGKTIMHGMSLQPQALWNMFRTVLALGDDPEVVDSSDFDFICDDYIAKECVVTVRIRDYEGQAQNQITNMRALTEDEASKLS